MCKLDFKVMLSSMVRQRESTSNKNIFNKKDMFLSNFREFGVNYSAFTEGAIFT